MSREPGHSEEITLKETILTTQEYWKEIKSKFLVLILFVILLSSFQLFKYFTAKSTYEAPLSFMLNEEDGSAGGAISGLLGQIGLPIGGGETNLDKILELAKSRKIAQQALFTKKTINGNDDYLANHLISMLKEKNEWNRKGFLDESDEYDIDNFSFTHDSFPSFSMTENKALKQLHGHLLGSKEVAKRALLNNSQNEPTGIMTILASTYDPEISVALSKSMFEVLSTYYVDKTIEKQEYTFELIQAKTDSIYEELQQKNYSLANFKDKNQSLFARTDQLTESRLMMEIQKLSAMYGEATKNLEIAEFSLKNKTPFIQLIDEPVLPIEASKSSLIKSLITGIILGLFLGVFYLVTRKMIRDALS